MCLSHRGRMILKAAFGPSRSCPSVCSPRVRTETSITGHPIDVFASPARSKRVLTGTGGKDASRPRIAGLLVAFADEGTAGTQPHFGRREAPEVECFAWWLVASHQSLPLATETMTSSIHVSVLLDEVVQWLNPQAGGVFVDGTLGGGGHARALAARVGPAGLVIGVDRDSTALDSAQESLAGLSARFVQANFCDLPEVLRHLEIRAVDGIVMDLGMSSDQLADPQRGFAFPPPDHSTSASIPPRESQRGG